MPDSTVRCRRSCMALRNHEAGPVLREWGVEGVAGGMHDRSVAEWA